MTSVLDELWSGNIEPTAKCFDRNSEYAKLMEIISDSEEKLLSTLNEPERSLLQAFSNAQGDLNVITARENFVSGFKLGALILLEVVAGKKEFVIEESEE